MPREPCDGFGPEAVGQVLLEEPRGLGTGQLDQGATDQDLAGIAKTGCGGAVTLTAASTRASRSAAVSWSSTSWSWAATPSAASASAAS